MSDVDPALALAMVERGLRLDVLPLVADEHAAAALRAALTIVGNVRVRLEIGDRALREVLSTALPVAEGWAAAISSPGTAEEVRHLVERARASAGTEPVVARESLLRAAQLCFTATWHGGKPDLDLLAGLRRVTRLDAQADAPSIRS
ncbi:MAG TPA: hypothetical protein VL595_03855 [Pseudonocardia sp.]|nr:hypothetical protein [Pseudonocardia sp.]